MVFKYSAGNPTRLCDHIFQAPFFTPIYVDYFRRVSILYALPPVIPLLITAKWSCALDATLEIEAVAEYLYVQ